MGTPASLLDLIAKGGSIPGFNEAQQSQANTALTNAQVENVPIQGQLMQAQTAAQQATAQKQQLENQQIQQSLDAAKTLAQIFQDQAQGTTTTPTATPQATATPTGATPSIATPGFVNGPGGPPQAAAPRVSISDPNSMLSEMLRRGVPYPYAVDAASKMVQFGSNALKLTGEQRANAEAIDEKVGSLIQNLQALPAGQRQPVLASELPQLESLDPSTNWRAINPDDDNQLQQVIAGKILHGTILAQTKTQAETSNQSAQTAEHQATTAKTGAETAKINFENKLLTGGLTPANIESAANDIAPATQYPDINRQLQADLRNAKSIAAIQEAQNKASSAVLARTPEATKAKAEEAKEVAKATAPVEEAKAETLARANYGRELEKTATAKYEQSLEDQAQSVGTANTIQKVLELSKSNSALASQQLKALLPAYTNAVNDLKSRAVETKDQGLTTTYEHLASELSSIANGNPLSARTQQEVAPYLQTISEGAIQKHNSTVDQLRLAYPGQASNFKKVFPSARVHEYATDHGMTDEAAKKAIGQSGYVVQ